MRVVQVNDIASVASEIAAGLRDRGHEVDLFEPRLFGARLHPYLKPLTIPFRAIDWLDLVRRIRRGRYDLVHIHYAYLGNLGAIGRFPYVLHCHGTDLRGANRLTGPLIRRAMKRARHVFYSTPDLDAWALPLRPDAEFLPNPIDTETFRPDRPSSEGEGIFVYSVLTEVKGAGKILEACRILARERPDVRITAIASGPYAPLFEELPNVRMIARQPRWKLPAIINEHALILGQTKLGIAGMAELEAMACARPVVAWFTMGAAYTDAPPLFSPETPAGIAGAAMDLLDDPAGRDEAGERGRDWVIRHHQRDRIAERVEAVAAALAAGQPVPPAPPA
jgi:glycosyltransferase involved in cell wall biosynthesis